MRNIPKFSLPGDLAQLAHIHEPLPRVRFVDHALSVEVPNLNF
jgi:hypothetical protein